MMMGSGQYFQIGHLIQKMTSSDKDFRFMATNDLLSELQKGAINLDDDAEKRIVSIILQLLKDSNAEVQNLAVKCIGRMVVRSKEHSVNIILDQLCTNVISSDDMLNEISGIALKQVIIDIQGESVQLISNLCKKVVTFLLRPVTTTENYSMQLEGLELLAEMTVRFPKYMFIYYTQVVKSIMPLLDSNRFSVCKRAIACLGCISVNCTNEMYDEIMINLMEHLDASEKDHYAAKVYICCITAICRNSGARMAEYLNPIFSTILQKLITIDDDELKESYLLLFEIALHKCTKEMSNYIIDIIQISIKNLTHDPNYNYDDENDDEDMEMDNDGEENDESEEDFSDDDDMSWKVRRASAKALNGAIATRLDSIDYFYQVIAPALISQFREREENVKVEIFNTYIVLLRQTRNVKCQVKYLDVLRGQVPQIVRLLERQLKEKSIKTRQSAFNLLGELVTLLPNALADADDQRPNFLNNIIPGVLYSLNSNSATSSMKVEALVFLNLLLTTHKAVVFRNYFAALITEVNKAVGDSFYKIASEALAALTLIIPIIRSASQVDASTLGFVDAIYASTLGKLETSDADQEVKERAIICMAEIVCVFGEHMNNRHDEVFALFLERLRNEVTRLTCVKSMNKIVCTAKSCNLGSFFPAAFPLLGGLLRQNKRNLRLNTLQLLENVCKYYSQYMSQEINEAVLLNEIVPLLSESDLHVSQLTLNVVTSMILSHKAFSDVIPQTFLPEALLLIRSPLLQGSTLDSMVNFFGAIVKSSFPGLDGRELILRLTHPILVATQQSPLHRQAFNSVAKCIASIILLDEALAYAVIGQLIDQVMNPQGAVPNSNPDFVQLYSLLTIAETGKHMNLAPISTQLREAIDHAFSASNEEVKSAASATLGSVAVGNLEHFLPYVITELTNVQRRQYLLMNALKEIIACSSSTPEVMQHLEPHLEQIWSLLVTNAHYPDDGTRYVVADCMGKLTLLRPQVLLPQVVSYLGSSEKSVRETAVNAIRFTITDRPHEIDELLIANMGAIIQTLDDQNLDVRRLGLLAFNSILHNKPKLIRDHFQAFLPLLYRETEIKKEFIREVEMGPFKHIVDDGLDLRKTAYECLYTLLESCLDKIDIFQFIKQVLQGLEDNYDIKMLNYHVLIRLADLYPSAILQKLKEILVLLRETMVNKLKDSAVKQEKDKQDELRRSAIRAFCAINNLPVVDKEEVAKDLMLQIYSKPDLRLLYDQVVSSNNKRELVHSMGSNETDMEM